MSGVRTHYDNVQINLSGPARSEQTARNRLAQVLIDGFAEGYPEQGWEGLSECEYLHFSQWDERIAAQIAEKVPYIVKGNAIDIAILSLDVYYKNDRKHWKYWASIRKGQQMVEPGDPA